MIGKKKGKKSSHLLYTCPLSVHPSIHPNGWHTSFRTNIDKIKCDDRQWPANTRSPIYNGQSIICREKRYDIRCYLHYTIYSGGRPVLARYQRMECGLLFWFLNNIYDFRFYLLSPRLVRLCPPQILQTKLIMHRSIGRPILWMIICILSLRWHSMVGFMSIKACGTSILEKAKKNEKCRPNETEIIRAYAVRRYTLL